MIKPYFYILSFKNRSLWYAGMRYANSAHHSEDLIKIYKTSSKKVHQLISNGFNPDIEEVVEFDTREEVAEYEYQFLKKCYKEKYWLNEALNHPFRKCDKKNDIKHGNELNRKITGKDIIHSLKKPKKKNISRKKRPYDPTHLAGARPLNYKPPKQKMKVGRRAQRKRNALKKKLFM